MAIAFDVSTVAAAYTATGTQTTSHVASASARAAVVLISKVTVADEVSGVTYGGVAMTRLRFDTEATEAGAVYVYWLDGVTGGTQNVAMTTTGTANKQLVVATMTVAAGQGVGVAGHATGTSASVANPSWSITGLTSATVLTAFEVIHSGLQTMTATPAASWTLISSTDLGATGRGFAYQQVASSGTSLACGWTASTADDFVGASVAFLEVAPLAVTYQASGTCAVVAASSGDAGRVPLVLDASGTTVVVSAVSGDATLAAIVLAASGAVAVVSATSGNPDRVPLVLAATGTIAVIATVSGNATRVPLTLAATGTIPVVAASSGDATRVPLTLAASGTIPAVAASSGNPTRVALTLGASGTIPVVSSTTGDATRVLLTLAASGTIPAITATSGNPTVVGAGGQTFTVSGQVTVTSTAAGDVTRTVLVLAAAGTVVVMATTSGDAARLGLILAVSGTVGVVSGVVGAVFLHGSVPLILNPRLALLVPAHLTVLTVPDTRVELT